METIRHFVATVYVVHDGATLLHEHDRLGLWLPPGGHLGRDELPREAAKREIREETGLDIALLGGADGEIPDGVASPTVRERAGPAHLLLEDIDRGDAVEHQHVDFVYVGRAASRDLDPAPGEAPADAWEWFGEKALREGGFEPDVVELGCEAIERVAGESSVE